MSNQTYDYLTTQVDTCQPLADLSPTGKARPWAEHRREADLLAYVYDDVDDRKAARLRSCAPRLTFEVKQEGGGLRLRNAWFCRVRLCPVCQWRRALKVYGQTTQIIDAANASRPAGYGWIMLTLTVRNVDGLDLANELDLLALGTETARSLGLRAGRMRVILLALAAGLAGAAVSVGGLIGFVGLIVPHLVRRLVGEESRPLVVGCAFGGAALLTALPAAAAPLRFAAMEMPKPDMHDRRLQSFPSIGRDFHPIRLYHSQILVADSQSMPPYSKLQLLMQRFISSMLGSDGIAPCFIVARLPAALANIMAESISSAASVPNRRPGRQHSCRIL